MALTILNGPSAGGKTTLMEMIMAGAFGKPALPVTKLLTVTTRKPRAGEVDGIHYHFMSEEEYDKYDDAGDMIEKTVYAGVKYGVLRQDLEPLFNPDHKGIVVMDFWGFGKMVEFLGKENVDMVFVYADLDVLRKRMQDRGDQPEVIERRLKQAEDREYVGKNFSSLIINTEDDIEACYHKLYAHLTDREFKRAMIYGHTGIDMAG